MKAAGVLVLGVLLACLFVSPVNAEEFHGEMLCSIEVEINGGYTLMKDCRTGSLLFHSTDAASLINDAIGNLTTGGTIFIRAGTYTLTSHNVNMGAGQTAAVGSSSISNIELEGEGNTTVLRLGANANTAIIGLLNVNRWYIHDLQLDGNRANQNATGNTKPFLFGIESFGGNNIRVEYVYVHDCKTFGIGVAYGNNPIIADNWVVNCNANGIGIDGSMVGAVVSHNVIIGASDVGLDIGAFDGNIVGSTFDNNIVQDISLGLSPFGVNSGDGIYFEGSEGYVINATTLDANTIDTASFGIAGLQTSYQILAEGNIMRNVGQGIYLTSFNGFTASDGTIDTVKVGPAIQVAGGTDVRIIGVTIREIYAASTYPYAIESDIDNTTIGQNNIVLGPRPPSGPTEIGVLLSSATHNMLTKNIVSSLLGPGCCNVGIELSNASYNTIVNNRVYSENNYETGIYMFASQHNTVQGNVVRLTGGAATTGCTAPIAMDGTSHGNEVNHNELTGGGYIAAICDLATNASRPNSLAFNSGYNPLGYIQYPFVNGTTDVICDGSSNTMCGGTTVKGSTPANTTTMTVIESPKLITIEVTSGYGASTLSVWVDGQELITNYTPSKGWSASYRLDPGETFKVTYWASATKFIVSGQ